MTLWIALRFALGFLALLGGADLLVRGASRLADSLGISRLVVGLTVVAIGTSAPELAVSVGSALKGQASIALGNVVGSNICNVLLVLGLSALVTPLTVRRRLTRLEVPIMIGASLLTFYLASDGVLSRVEGFFYVLGAFGFLTLSMNVGKSPPVIAIDEDGDRNQDGNQTQGEPSPAMGTRSLWWNIGLGITGLALLVKGADLLVDSAVKLARFLGVSELIIALTVVAVGTSLPEIAASVVAALRGERDLAVGNVVGSNVMNLLLVLGATALVSKEGIAVPSGALSFDLPVMVAVAVACLPVFLTGRGIERWEGGLFVVYYIAFTLYLVFNALNHPWRASFEHAMIGFVIPLTVVTLIVSVAGSLRRASKR